MESLLWASLLWNHCCDVIAMVSLLWNLRRCCGINALESAVESVFLWTQTWHPRRTQIPCMSQGKQPALGRIQTVLNNRARKSRNTQQLHQLPNVNRKWWWERHSPTNQNAGRSTAVAIHSDARKSPMSLYILIKTMYCKYIS